MLAPLEAPAACHREFVKTSHLNFLKARRRDVVNYSGVEVCYLSLRKPPEVSRWIVLLGRLNATSPLCGALRKYI